MLVKFKKNTFLIHNHILERWHEIQIELAVRKEKKNRIKSKTIKYILENRHEIKKYIKLNDKKLKKELDNLPDICYDRAGMQGLKSPFRILE